MKNRDVDHLKKGKLHSPRLNVVAVDKSKVHHHSLYYEIPDFYNDKKFSCRECSKEETWTGLQQKWWYEEAGGDLETTAVRCHDCREKIKKEKFDQKKHMVEVGEREPHPNEKFFK